MPRKGNSDWLAICVGGKTTESPNSPTLWCETQPARLGFRIGNRRRKSPCLTVWRISLVGRPSQPRTTKPHPVRDIIAQIRQDGTSSCEMLPVLQEQGMAFSLVMLFFFWTQRVENPRNGRAVAAASGWRWLQKLWKRQLLGWTEIC